MASNIKQPLKWHGGKNYIAKDIVAMMPRHLNYVEPYFGGGAVLLARNPDDESLWLPPHKGVSEVINDLHLDLTNFWKTLQDLDSFRAFKRIVDATPFSGFEYHDAGLELQEWPVPLEKVSDRVIRAWRFFIVARQSLAGRMKGFTGITKTRTRSRMNNEVSAWLNCIDNLPSVHERLRRVLILPPQPALNVIRAFNGPDTLLYLDPPYLHETRVTTGEYLHEMTWEDHNQLLAVLGKLQGKFLLSGYHSNLYDGATKEYGWKCREFQVPNAASGARKKETKTECVWYNF